MSIYRNYHLLIISLSFNGLFAATSCRNEKKEGWEWASSLVYKLNNGKSIDFNTIHSNLVERHNTLKELLDENGNICVAQINFVLEALDESDHSTILINNLSELAKELKVNIPLEKHLFISGYDTPESDGVIRRNFYTDREQESNKKLKIHEPHLRAFQAIQEVIKGKDTKIELDDPIVIHPSKPYFLDLEFVVKRLVDRYKGSLNETVPLKAALARDWVELHKKQTKSLRNRILGSRIFRRKVDKKPSQKVIEWFNEASRPFPNHGADESAADKSESSNLFFTNNADSEQRLFYYLDHITLGLEEFENLKEIIQAIKEWYDSSGTHKARLINNLMNLCDSKIGDTDKIGALVAEINACQEYNPSSKNDEKKIKKELQLLRTRCDALRESRGDDCFRLNKLYEYIKQVQEGFEELLELYETANLGLWTELAKKLEKDKQGKAKDDGAFLKVAQRQYRSKFNTLKAFEQDILEALKTEKLFAEVLAQDEFKVDLELAHFARLAKECLIKNPRMRISAVVLNIHSTHDICYSCAPDLARESVRPNSFAEYFSKKAYYLNLEEKRGDSMPFFRVVYSCGNIRKGVRCKNCAFQNKEKKVPLWEKPNIIAFYQHYIEQKIEGNSKPQRVNESNDWEDKSRSSTRAKIVNVDDDEVISADDDEKTPIIAAKKDAHVKKNKKKKPAREALFPEQ